MKLRRIETLSPEEESVVIFVLIHRLSKQLGYENYYDLRECYTIRKIDQTTITYMGECGCDSCDYGECVDKADVKGWIYKEELEKYLGAFEVEELEG